MSVKDLEKRVEALEKELKELKAKEGVHLPLSPDATGLSNPFINSHRRHGSPATDSVNGSLHG